MLGITCSIGEISALVQKAARGVGMPVGLAQEAGWAAAWLARRRLPAAEVAATFFETMGQWDYSIHAPARFYAAGGIVASTETGLCPVMAGSTISDEFVVWKDNVIHIHRLLSPALLLPFAARLSESTGSTIRVDWEETRIEVTPESVVVHGDPSAVGIDFAKWVVIRRGTQDNSSKQVPSLRAHCHSAAWQRLNNLAHRTRVPASSYSREAGAGESRIDDE